MSRSVNRAAWAAGMLWVVATARAQYGPPAGYYDTATGTGAVLKAQLNAIIDGHTAISYSNRVAPIDVLDQDPANNTNILEVYTGTSVAKSEFPSGSANTEHLWPQSYGIDGTEPAYGDLFNLRPCDSSVNSARGNKFYDDGGNPPSGAPLCKTDSDSWEVRDIEKGDIARAMFYMDTRYEGDSNDGFSRDLMLTDNTALITSSNNYMGKLSTLVDWSFRDPVSTEERARNHKIFTDYQHNRNPYVDHPEYVWAVYGSGPNNSRLYVGSSSPLDGASSAMVTFRVIREAPIPSASITLTKTGTHPTTYNVTAAGSAVCSAAGTGEAFIGGTQTRSIPVALDLTTLAGGRSGTVTIDNTDLTSAGTGFGSADGNDVITVNAAVLEHSNASFAPAADQNSLTIDFGTVYAASGLHTQTFSIYNLEAVAGYTAGLDLDTVAATGDTARISTDLASFGNLSAGQSRSYTATLNTSVIGTWQTVVTLEVSDEDVPGAATGTALTLTLRGVVAPLVIVAADFNGDGDVDSDDFAIFAACLNGAARTPAHAGCGATDLDGDGDVDMADFAIFQRCLSGSGNAPDPNCAG